MKVVKVILFSLFILCGVFANAQTQQGVVKTRGKMVNGKLVPGEGLSGATVLLGDRNVVSKGEKGAFSFPTQGKRYLVKGCKKQNYQLIDMQVCREYKYSGNPLYLVMETPEQQQSDLLAKERSLRRDLQRRLQKREDEVDNLNLSLQEKNRLLQEINRQRDENEKLIKDLAQYYSTLDYDRLDEFQRQVSYLLENNELEKADSMLRSRGSIDDRIKEIQREQEAEAKEDSVIAQRQQNNEVSKAGTRRKLEDVASDCYSFYLRFSQDHQNDSAAHYLEYRAALDTTNIEWQNEAGMFIDNYLADYSKGLTYYQRCLRQALLQEGEKGEWVATSYNNIGFVYNSQGDYAKALEYYQKALAIREKVFGTEHPGVATSYNNIGSIYSNQGDYAKALEYHQKALAIQEKLFGTEHPDVALSYNNIGSVYNSQGDYAKALEYYQKALSIFEKVFGTEHPNTKTVKKNIEIVEKEIVASNPEKMKDYIFTATVVDGDTPARQQQMSGEYVVLEFADWNIESTTSLYDMNGQMRGKPKTIVVMKNDVISLHHFENTIGVHFDLKQVGQKEKERMIEKYRQWKKQ